MNSSRTADRAIWKSFWERTPRPSAVWQIARFLATGLINTAVALCVIIVLIVVFGFDDAWANFLGYLTGIVLGFFLNKNWTFQSKENGRLPLCKYLAAFVIAYAINLVIVIALSGDGVNRFVAHACGVPAYTSVFFLLCRYLVFPDATRS